MKKEDQERLGRMRDDIRTATITAHRALGQLDRQLVDLDLFVLSLELDSLEKES